MSVRNGKERRARGPRHIGPGCSARTNLGSGRAYLLGGLHRTAPVRFRWPMRIEQEALQIEGLRGATPAGNAGCRSRSHDGVRPCQQRPPRHERTALPQVNGKVRYGIRRGPAGRAQADQSSHAGASASLTRRIAACSARHDALVHGTRLLLVTAETVDTAHGRF
jgi:hypothetical protein